MSPLQPHTPRTRAKQNITDVDDKIIRRARELGIDAPGLARMHERATFALDADAGSAVVDNDFDRLIEEREQHRRNRRFADADRIRDELAAHGVFLEDSMAGVRWRRSTR